MAARKPAESIVDAYLNSAIKGGRAYKMDVSLKSLGRTPDQTYQTRVDGLDMDHVRRLCGFMDNEITLNPIVLFEIFIEKLQERRFFVVNGFHRIEAHWQKKLPAIPAWIIKGDAHEALLYAVSANLEFSKPLSREDMKKNATSILEDPECWNWADAEIAKRCGLRSTAIRKYRAEFSAERGIPLPDLVLSFRDGVPARSHPYGSRAVAEYLAAPEIRATTNRLGYKTYVANVHGKSVHLGKSISEAKDRLKLAMSSRETATKKDSPTEAAPPSKIISGEMSHLAVLLRRSGTRCHFARELGCNIRGLVVDSHVLGLVPVVSARELLLAVGQIAFIRAALNLKGRTVICTSKIESDCGTSLLVRLAPSCNPAVEFMTPEEIVAEFGPREGQATDEAASA